MPPLKTFEVGFPARVQQLAYQPERVYVSKALSDAAPWPTIEMAPYAEVWFEVDGTMRGPFYHFERTDHDPGDEDARAFSMGNW